MENSIENLSKYEYVKAIDRAMEQLASKTNKTKTSITRITGFGTETIDYEMIKIAVNDMGHKSIEKYSENDYYQVLRALAIMLIKLG